MSAQQPRAIVIGASAGALDALSAILPGLPENFPLPVMIVVHLPVENKSMLVELLRGKCAIHVSEAEDKERISPGVAYIAPPDYHLLIESDYSFSLSSDEPVLFSRPSIDVLFESAADIYGSGLTGVVLTGSNSDGAHGLRTILDHGGKGVIQSPVKAYANAMPKAAIALCPEAAIFSLEQIKQHFLASGRP